MNRWLAALGLASLPLIVACGGQDTETADEDLTGAAATITICDGESSASALQPVHAVVAAKLIERLFDRFLTDDAQCSDDALPLEEARDRGQMVPYVDGRVEGSFTSAGAAETLYLLHVGECHATHADNFGSAILVVTRGDEIVARLATTGGTDVHLVVDLDGDGRSEVVLTTGWVGQGYVLENATVTRLQRDAIATLRDFPEVKSDACATGNADAKSEWSVVRAKTRPGAEPEYVVEPRSAACPPM